MARRNGECFFPGERGRAHSSSLNEQSRPRGSVDFCFASELLEKDADGQPWGWHLAPLTHVSSSSLRLAPGFIHPFILPLTTLSFILANIPSTHSSIYPSFLTSLQGSYIYPSSCPFIYPTTLPYNFVSIFPYILFTFLHKPIPIYTLSSSPLLHPCVCSSLYPSSYISTHHFIHILIYTHIHPFFLGHIYTLICANSNPLSPIYLTQ